MRLYLGYRKFCYSTCTTLQLNFVLRHWCASLLPLFFFFCIFFFLSLSVFSSFLLCQSKNINVTYVTLKYKRSHGCNPKEQLLLSPLSFLCLLTMSPTCISCFHGKDRLWVKLLYNAVTGCQSKPLILTESGRHINWYLNFLNAEFWKKIPPNEPYRVILGDVRDKLYHTRERSRHLLASGYSDIPVEATFTSVEQVPISHFYQWLCQKSNDWIGNSTSD